MFVGSASVGYGTGQSRPEQQQESEFRDAMTRAPTASLSRVAHTRADGSAFVRPATVPWTRQDDNRGANDATLRRGTGGGFNSAEMVQRRAERDANADNRGVFPTEARTRPELDGSQIYDRVYRERPDGSTYARPINSTPEQRPESSFGGFDRQLENSMMVVRWANGFF